MSMNRVVQRHWNIAMHKLLVVLTETFQMELCARDASAADCVTVCRVRYTRN